MENTRLINLLKTFSPDEMKNFEKFVSSPYFSKGRNLMPLYSVLKKNYPEFQSSKLTQEKIYKKLFPGKKFDKQKSPHLLNVIISELTKLAEKFLAFELLQNENEGYLIYRAQSRSLKQRNQNHNMLKLTLRNIERINKSDSDIISREMINLNEELMEIYYLSNQYEQAFQTIKKIQFFTYCDYLLIWCTTINNYLAISNVQRPASFDKDIEILKEGLGNFNPKIFEKEFYYEELGHKQLALMNYYIANSQIETDIESLSTAFQYFRTNFDKFSWQIKRNIFQKLLNIYLIKGTKVPVKNTDNVINEFIDFAIGNQLYADIIGNPMTKQFYIIFFGIKNNILDLAELESFADNTLKLVEIDSKQLMHGYSYAYINFKKRNYEKTLELVSKMSSMPKNLKVLMERLKILSLYSLNYIVETIYNLDSYEHFIRVSIKSGFKTFTRYLPFINSMMYLINCKTKKLQFDENSFNKTLEGQGYLDIDFWFKEEAEKLKAGFKSV